MKQKNLKSNFQKPTELQRHAIVTQRSDEGDNKQILILSLSRGDCRWRGGVDPEELLACLPAKYDP